MIKLICCICFPYTSNGTVFIFYMTYEIEDFFLFFIFFFLGELLDNFEFDFYAYAFLVFLLYNFISFEP